MRARPLLLALVAASVAVLVGLPAAGASAEVLPSAGSVAPTAIAQQASSTVRLSSYRVPDEYLTIPYKGGSLGYGYPPAYGFDTADHNIQCYLAQSEDSTIYACGIQKHRWSLPTTGLDCRKPAYVGVQGFVTAEGGASGACSPVPIVPRERKPGSSATTGRQVNTVLPAGKTITAFGFLTCSASGHGRSSAITCTDSLRKKKAGFRISYDALTIRG